jgi:outer membrane biosynthesis protein TonB
MERWQFIGWGIAASVLAHILLAGSIVLSTNVRTYDQAAPDPIPVDVVSEEPEKTAEPTPTPSPTASTDLTLPNPAVSPSPQSAQSAPSPQSAPSQQAATQPAPQPQPSPQPQPQPTPRESAQPQAKATPQPQTQPQPEPQPMPSASPEPQPRAQGYIPAQPDLTVKYGVMLGLPEALPPLAKSADNHDDDKEAGSTATSNLANNLVAAFRGHLRTCSRLPSSISSADNVRVKLRVIMNPDGRLAAQPDVIEVASPLKALDLKQAAVTALAACQPYTMLPPDRYREWRVLELTFTPQDFAN